jgi:hypothetical protein
VAADPFEYEIASQPLPPSYVSSGSRTRPLPEGSPIATWSYLIPPPSPATQAAGKNIAQEESDVKPCLPRSQAAAVGMGTAGRVGLPPAVAFEGRRTAALNESSLHVLNMQPAPATNVVLDFRPQSDVLVELLDQQIPRPDRLHALSQFAARQTAWIWAGPTPTHLEAFSGAAAHAMPSDSALSVFAPGYRLSVPEMRGLPADVNPAPGNVVSRAEISEIAITPQTGMWVVSMPAAEASVRQVRTAGLRRLPSSLSLPVTGVFALQTRGSLDLDLSAGVSADITFPSFTDASAHAGPPRLKRLLSLTFAKKRKPALDAARPEGTARLLPETVESHPVIPHSGLEPLDRKPAEDALRSRGSGLGSLIGGEGLRRLEPAWAHATGFWHHAPRDLKLLLFAIPALLALVFHPGLPRVAFAAPQSSGGFTGSFKRVLSNQWMNVHTTLENRAAVALDEDFRSGLDNWASPQGSTTEWSFDATGFVRPGPLALYRPSVNLSDYQVQFLGLIDKKALSWVVRAADFQNFYVVKLEVLKPGPMPSIGLTRYAVIDGKAQDRHDVNIPISARTDTVYRVRMDVQGSNFTVEVQGQIADSWTETRLPRGGVGFFTAGGEASRLRWVQITHQYDMLGRLCAYLAPYDTTNGSWQP